MGGAAAEEVVDRLAKDVAGRGEGGGPDDRARNVQQGEACGGTDETPIAIGLATLKPNMKRNTRM